MMLGCAGGVCTEAYAAAMSSRTAAASRTGARGIAAHTATGEGGASRRRRASHVDNPQERRHTPVGIQQERRWVDGAKGWCGSLAHGAAAVKIGRAHV